MKFSLKAVALTALAASLTTAAPIEKRDAQSDRIIACFAGLLLTGSWPGSCQAAISVDMGLIKSIAINQMSMDFTPANPWAPKTSSSSVVATMLSIPGITLPIDKIKQSIIIVDNNVQLGTIDTPWAAASVKGGTLTTSFPSSDLNVFPDAHDAFSSFVASLSTKPSHSFTLKGVVDAQLNLGFFGRMTIPGIGFKSTVPMVGLNGLKFIDYLFLVDTRFQPDGSIIITTIVNIENPSQLTVSLGDVNFSTSNNGNYVGISTIKGLTLVPGKNYAISTTVLEDNPATKALLTNIGTADQPLILTGTSTSTANPALNAGLSAIQSQLTIPKQFLGSAMSQVPYSDWSLKPLPSTNSDLIVEATATFKSPYYGYPIEMTTDATPGTLQFATVQGTGSTLDNLRLFFFNGALKFSVSGTGTTTVSFGVKLKRTPFTAGEKPRWQKLVDYAAANKTIPVKLSWTPNVILNNDGIVRTVNWGTDMAKLTTINISTGSDFAAILAAFPA